MLLKQKDSAYSRSVQAVSHSLSKPTWMGRTGKTGVKPDLPSANAFFDRVWTFSLTRCWKQRTTSCSTSQASSKQTSCMECIDIRDTFRQQCQKQRKKKCQDSHFCLLCKNCTTRPLPALPAATSILANSRTNPRGYCKCNVLSLRK